jgi:P-type E1-E2 ATPase
MANRSQMEIDIIFSGFIVMENKLKAETPGVLQELAKAGLRVVMVTGDNPLTAISVSRWISHFNLEVILDLNGAF